jgi:outer membrane protein assembly factor BamA
MKKFILQAAILIIFIFTKGTIFSQQNTCISNIYLLGNRTTKDHILLRELPFKQGDSLKVQNLEKILTEAKNNILNLSLFNFVYVIPSKNPYLPNSTDIIISVEERWFVWPLVSFVYEERNLSSWLEKWDMERISVDGGIKAYNIWGLNNTLTLSYKFGFRKGVRFEYDNISLGPTGRHMVGIGFYLQNFGTENYISRFNTPLYKTTYQDIARKLSARISYSYRPTIRKTHRITIEYERFRISDTLLMFNPRYWGGEDTVRTGSWISYSFTSDQRDNYQYPLKGYLINGELRGYKGINNGVMYGQIRGRAQYFLPLGNRWYFATSLSAGLSCKNVEGYVFDKAIGYENATMRGYEYYVIDGQKYAVLNPTLRYQILPTRIINLHLFPFLKKFNKMHLTIYGKGFFDTGYSYHSYPEPTNSLENRFLYSGGFGVDLITYYDINLSLDYSFNQLGGKGFFFAFKSLIF